MRLATVCLLVCVQVLGLAPWATAAGGAPVAVLGATELAAWYQAQTGYAPDAGYFGAYALLPVGETLYLGLGTARPAEADGALLASYDAAGLHALGPLDEQGFIDMTLADGRLYIPGADPTDDWSTGNLYVYDLATETVVKRRTLPQVIHAWQVRATDGQLRVTVGRYLPERGAWPWAGGILTSTDGGLTWTVDDSPALGTSRTYDLVRGPAGDVALVDDAAIEGCRLATRSPGGAWQQETAWVRCGRRLVSDPANRRVLALGADLRSVVLAGREQSLPLPCGVDPWAYHWATLVDRTLYVLADDGRVLASDNLRQWRTVATVDAPLLSVAYWPTRHSLVVATRGAAAGLWLVPVR